MTRSQLGIVLLALAAVAGCGPYAPSAKTDTIQQREKVLFQDYKVKRYLKLVKHTVERLPSGSLKTQVVLVNTKNKDLWCDVLVRFHDQDGNVVEPGNWEPMLFARRAETTIERKSISPHAADYRIAVRKQE